MSKDLRESRALPILNYTNHKKEGGRMEKITEKKVMILNRKSRDAVTVRPTGCDVLPKIQVASSKDKIPIVIKNMQFTLNKY